MSSLQAVPIVDKNGKKTTVRKRTNTDTSSKVDKVSVKSRPASNHIGVGVSNFPVEAERKTISVIKKTFESAVEFRFDFEVDGDELHVFDREIVQRNGDIHSDSNGDAETLEKLDVVTNRLVDSYYSLGAFGSDECIRLVNTLDDRYVAIRLD